MRPAVTRPAGVDLGAPRSTNQAQGRGALPFAVRASSSGPYLSTHLPTPMQIAQPITLCLWFDGQAEEAAAFYVSVFDDARITHVSRYSEAGQEVHGRPEGSAMTVSFELGGQPFTALNGGPHFRFNEAVSFQVICDSQNEVEYYWTRLSEGGDEQAQQCGWLKDRFGLSWQVIPRPLFDMLSDGDAERAARVTEAMLAMKKLDLAELERAYIG